LAYSGKYCNPDSDGSVMVATTANTVLMQQTGAMKTTGPLVVHGTNLNNCSSSTIMSAANKVNKATNPIPSSSTDASLSGQVDKIALNHPAQLTASNQQQYYQQQDQPDAITSKRDN
jgi:hypothetical protein